MEDVTIEEFIKTLSPEAIQTVKMLAAIGPVVLINEVRNNILNIGDHPNKTIGNSPLSSQYEFEVFRPPASEGK